MEPSLVAHAVPGSLSIDGFLPLALAFALLGLVALGVLLDRPFVAHRKRVERKLSFRIPVVPTRPLAAPHRRRSSVRFAGMTGVKRRSSAPASKQSVRSRARASGSSR